MTLKPARGRVTDYNNSTYLKCGLVLPLLSVCMFYSVVHAHLNKRDAPEVILTCLTYILGCNLCCLGSPLCESLWIYLLLCDKKKQILSSNYYSVKKLFLTLHAKGCNRQGRLTSTLGLNYSWLDTKFSTLNLILFRKSTWNLSCRAVTVVFASLFF